MQQPLHIGPYRLRNPVFLAPMAGVTDAPFRTAAWRLGAGLTVAEMAAGRELLRGRHLHRLAGENIGATPFVVQLAGHDPQLMTRAAVLAMEHGAQAIDINMGCPARLVTGKLSGAALMRDESLALAIAHAVLQVAAPAGVPVSVKMRLGWDDSQRNAPRLATMLADAGIAMITVHGRTRQQFYQGQADWPAVGEVVQALRHAGHDHVPIIVNGDITDAASASRALAQSGADGVMIGRAAMGRPWLPGEIATALQQPATRTTLPPARQVEEILHLHAAMLDFHGPQHGLRRARKHLKAALMHWQAAGWLPPSQAHDAAARLLRSDDARTVRDTLRALQDLARQRQLVH